MDYCIDLSHDLNNSKIFIPPLLIQPIVDNAIIHGIVPSKNKGIIVISMDKQQNRLWVKVEDNGIGLEKSKKQKKKSKNNHQSMGNKILKERVTILNHNQREKIIFKIGNLNIKGVSSRTCTSLFIPFSTLQKLKPKSNPEPLIYEKN